MPNPPALSIVVVALRKYASIRRVVRHVREQTIHDAVELVVVAPNADALAECADDEGKGLYALTRVYSGPIADREYASALGIQQASAPVIALVEDHAFPEPDWAERLVEAHKGPWAAVGPAVLNGNPGVLSWTNMLLSYGGWPPTLARGEINEIALHNSSFKRDILTTYGDKLGHLLSRSGGLLKELRTSGHKFLFEPGARIHHVNPSTLTATLQLRVMAGRLYAASRAESEHWSVAKRAIYTVLSPALPAIRLASSGKSLLGGRSGLAALAFLPHVLAGLVLDSAGQAIGYAFGPGDTAETLANFELIRLTHLNARDRAAMVG